MKQSFAKAMVLLTVIFMDLLAGTEFDLFVPSFPELQAQFGLTSVEVEALLSVNFIGYAISLFFVGGLADRYGRKPIIILGLVIFVIGSLLCLSEAVYSVLLIGRFLQGVGVAAPAILSFLIIADTYPLKQQQFYMAMLNGVMNASVALAPVVGSYITLHFKWQGNFLALLGLGIIVLAMTLYFIPYQKPEHTRDQVVSLRGYLPLLKSKPLLLLMANIICMFLPYWVFVGISPLLYMTDLGVSISHFGYYQGVLALVFAAGSVISGLVIRKYSSHTMLVAAGGLYIFGLITVASVTFPDSANPLFITLAFLPFILSQVLPSTMLIPLCLNFIPEAKGRVSAILQGGRLIFAAASLQVAGYIYSGSFQSVGWVLLFFIFASTVTHFLVMKNPALMNAANTQTN